MLPTHTHATAPIQAAETGMRRRLPAGESQKGLAVKLWKAENRPDWSLCWRCTPLGGAEKAAKRAHPTRELNHAACSVLKRGTGREGACRVDSALSTAWTCSTPTQRESYSKEWRRMSGGSQQGVHGHSLQGLWYLLVETLSTCGSVSHIDRTDNI